MGLFNKLTKKNNDKIFNELDKKEKGNKERDKNLPELSGMYLPDHVVAIPHYFSQTSIYAPRANKNRNALVKNKQEHIWSQGDLNIMYEGPELDTLIDSRLMSLVLKGRDLQKSKDNIVRLKFKETMLTLGLNPYHPNSRAKFTASIDRHLSAKIYFKKGENLAGFWKSFFISDNTYYEYETNSLQIQIGDMIPELFSMKDSGSFSIENMVISFATKNSYATKLYSYYESNTNPFPIKVSTILELCDKKLEENKKPTNNHRKVIKEALDELQELGFLESWCYDITKDKRDPLVCVKKRPKKERIKSPEKEKQFDSNYVEVIDYKK